MRCNDARIVDVYEVVRVDLEDEEGLVMPLAESTFARPLIEERPSIAACN